MEDDDKMGFEVGDQVSFINRSNTRLEGEITTWHARFGEFTVQITDGEFSYCQHYSPIHFTKLPAKEE